MNVLVGYASSHGSTRGVAERIGARLDEQGCRVEVRPLDQAGDVDGYDAAVLGSAIHNGAWLPPAAKFVRRNRNELAGRPVWLFSVAMIGDQNSTIAPAVTRILRRFGTQPKELADFRETIHPQGHHAFVGAIERSHLESRFGRLIYRAMGGRYGDYRNWTEIDVWVGGIASELVKSSA